MDRESKKFLYKIAVDLICLSSGKKNVCRCTYMIIFKTKIKLFNSFS